MESVVRGSLIGTVGREASFPKSGRTEEARGAARGYAGETGTAAEERRKTGGEERRIKIGLFWGEAAGQRGDGERLRERDGGTG